ncbi:hypothetical protein [Streptomyces sp. NPDC048606]
MFPIFDPPEIPEPIGITEKKENTMKKMDLAAKATETRTLQIHRQR